MVIQWWVADIYACIMVVLVGLLLAGWEREIHMEIKMEKLQKQIEKMGKDLRK